MMSLLENAKLIDLNRSHLEMILKWRNHDHIRSVMINNDIISKEEHLKWYDNVVKKKKAVVKVFYIGNDPVGVVNISNIDFKNQRCSWGFYIGTRITPTGTGTLMGYLTLNFVFNELNMRKLCSEVLAFNQRSLRYHTRFGFETEGILRRHILNNGKFIDVILMALFKEKWEGQESKIKFFLEGI
jgi:UDP-4-amino-4,6-dideoxy-N-acetyl-beta-L-altrosamine N-acetyltransferase